MIYEIPNFLDDQTCDMLIDYFKNSNRRSNWQEDKFFKGRTLSPHEISDDDIQKRMEIFKSKTLQISIATNIGSSFVPTTRILSLYV